MANRHEELTVPSRGMVNERGLHEPVAGRLLCTVAVTLVLTSTTSADDAPVSFSRDVRPLLSRFCSKCHGPDEGQRQSGLRLDRRESALAEADSGAHAIVPGKPDDSELLRRVFSTDPDERMPPPGTKMSLTDAQKEKLRRWIADGAEYETHWSFISPKKTPFPKTNQLRRGRNGIDRFVMARLEREGLAPEPEADRYTLARRVYLDLIGMPPTPEEADAFANDSRDDAYERLVDRLLESKHYGERWARRWLDLARYADTNGYEKDRVRSIWPYRDWVIKALNDDMPFDRFTVEQLAGDMLPKATVSQRIATGFHRNTMINEEGGIDPLEFRFHSMTDRVSTTATVWLGLTMGCAQCHTHKYDPITQREYYRFFAFLNNADEPDMDVPDDVVKTRHEASLREAEQLARQLASKWPVDVIDWKPLQPVSIAAWQAESPRVLQDRSILFASPGPKVNVWTIELETPATTIDQLRLEALVHESLPKSGPGRVAHGNFVLSEIEIEAAPVDNPASAVKIEIKSATASATQPKFPIEGAFDGLDETGWAVHESEKPLNRDKSAVFHFRNPIRFDSGTRLRVRLKQLHGDHHTIGRLRLSAGESLSKDIIRKRQRLVIGQNFRKWLTAERSKAVPWFPLKPTRAISNLPLLTIEKDSTIYGSGDTSKHDIFDIDFAVNPQLGNSGGESITALRIEALPDERLPAHGPGMTWYEGTIGDFYLTELELTADDRRVPFQSASHSFAKNRYGNNPAAASLSIDGDLQTGWSVHGRQGERHVAVFVLKQPIRSASQLNLKMHFGRHFSSSLGKFRVSATTSRVAAVARSYSPETERLLLLDDARLTDANRDRLRNEFLMQAPEVAKHAARIRELRKRPMYTTTLIMRERPNHHPRPTHVHRRGEYLQPTERVEADTPEVLHSFPEHLPRTRLGLARWLVSRDNPLTARVTVNRQWEAFFGTGLVRTTEDFGYQGELPSHPELLDWLAVEFMENDWSMKALHRLIVTSETYRQSSRVTEVKLRRDPSNRLLARGPRSRLEAELVRDSLLRISGLLSAKMGGPGVFPPQPASVTTEGTYGRLNWAVSRGEDRYRRGIYTFAKRTAPFAMFKTFDAPSGEACVPRRERSNTPLQALTLLNDEVFVEIARSLGEQIARMKNDSVERRARVLFRRCLTRPPGREELQLIVDFFRAQRGRIESGQLDRTKIMGEPVVHADPAAWTLTARSLLNLDETITKE